MAPSVPANIPGEHAPPSPRPTLSRLERVVLGRPGWLVFGLIVFSLIVGAVGIDFGQHWDEWYHSHGLKHCVERMQLGLDENQSYGGPYFYLGLPVLLASTAHELATVLRELVFGSPADIRSWLTFPTVRHFQAVATQILDSHAYLLRTRMVFFALSSLTIAWTYGAMVHLLPSRKGLALAAAAFVALSWELQYHFRILAIDGPLAQFIAMETCALVWAYRATLLAQLQRRCAVAGAAAGAAFACKMTAVFAVVPVIVLVLTWPGRVGWRPRAFILAASLGSFLLVTYVLSPSQFLDPLHFVVTIRTGVWDYLDSTTIASHPHYVPNPLEHLALLVTWLGIAVPSPFRALGIGFTLLALLGLVSLVRRERRLALLLVAYPVSFVLYFSTNKLMIVRQYVGLIPVMAIFFALGLGALDHLIRRVWVRTSLRLSVVLAFLLNAGWAVAASLSILTPHAESFARRAARDLLAHPRPIEMTPRAFLAVNPHLEGRYRCAAAPPRAPFPESFLSFQEENRWFVDRFPTFLSVYSNDDVDYAWYPTWIGAMRSVRLVEVPSREFLRRGLDTNGYFLCAPL